MAHSSSDPSAPAVATSGARSQPVTNESRCPRVARRLLHAALAIAMLSCACRVSAAQGTWSTAQLSEARAGLSATSLGDVAIFAGGQAGNLAQWVVYASFFGWSCFAQITRVEARLAALSRVRYSWPPSNDVHCS
jgi:hypothetical protein